MAHRIISKIWVLSAISESMDHYDNIAAWWSQPTIEEVHVALIESFAGERGNAELWECESAEQAEDEAPMSFEHNGKWYASYLTWTVA